MVERPRGMKAAGNAIDLVKRIDDPNAAAAIGVASRMHSDLVARGGRSLLASSWSQLSAARPVTGVAAQV